MGFWSRNEDKHKGAATKAPIQQIGPKGSDVGVKVQGHKLGKLDDLLQRKRLLEKKVRCETRIYELTRKLEKMAAKPDSIQVAEDVQATRAAIAEWRSKLNIVDGLLLLSEVNQ